MVNIRIIKVVTTYNKVGFPRYYEPPKMPSNNRAKAQELYWMFLFSLCIKQNNTNFSPCVLGIDRQLAEHVAHLFIRDPLAVYEEKLHIDDEEELDHFENIQSTNYQTVRFKPPPPGSNIGWRVELRPMEVYSSISIVAIRFYSKV